MPFSARAHILIFNILMFLKLVYRFRLGLFAPACIFLSAFLCLLFFSLRSKPIPTRSDRLGARVPRIGAQLNVSVCRYSNAFYRPGDGKFLVICLKARTMPWWKSKTFYN